MNLQFIGFAIVAVVAYLLADGAIKEYEKRSGKALPNRQIVFFILFFALTLLAFEAIKILFDKPVV